MDSHCFSKRALSCARFCRIIDTDTPLERITDSISGRELLTPDEVRMLDNRYAILFIRGELPVMDLKYDILKHPNVAYTADGKGGVYQHGEVTKNVATIETLYVDLDSVPEMELSETTYELLSDEDFENLSN